MTQKKSKGPPASAGGHFVLSAEAGVRRREDAKYLHPNWRWPALRNSQIAVLRTEHDDFWMHCDRVRAQRAQPPCRQPGLRYEEL